LRVWRRPTDTPTPLQVEVASDRTLEVLLELAEFSWEASRLAPGQLDGSSLSPVYRTWAREIGGITRSGYLRHDRLVAALRDDMELLAGSTRSLVPTGFVLKAEDLVGSLARLRPRPMHPMKHLAVLVCMFRDWTSFCDQLSSATRGEPAPQPSTAPAASSKRLPPERKAAFHRRLEEGSSVRSAALSTGVAVGTGVRWAKQSDIKYSSRAKILRSAPLAALRVNLAAGMNRDDAAKQAGVSKASVDRLLSTDHVLRDEWLKVRTEAKRAASRQAVLKAIADAVDLRASQLRKAHPAAWSWLYRNDRDWLEGALPALWHERSSEAK